MPKSYLDQFTYPANWREPVVKDFAKDAWPSHAVLEKSTGEIIAVVHGYGVNDYNQFDFFLVRDIPGMSDWEKESLKLVQKGEDYSAACKDMALFLEVADCICLEPYTATPEMAVRYMKAALENARNNLKIIQKAFRRGGL